MIFALHDVHNFICIMFLFNIIFIPQINMYLSFYNFCIMKKIIIMPKNIIIIYYRHFINIYKWGELFLSMITLILLLIFGYQKPITPDKL